MYICSLGRGSDIQLTLSSFHSCVLLFFRGVPSPATESPIWLVCTYPWLRRLDKLFPSSSTVLRGSELISDPAASPPFNCLANLSARFCCNSFVSSSTGRAPSIFSVAVGSKASTVKVQSVWFCSNRRRRLGIIVRYPHPV